jgi:uncharacterized protein (TIGR00255 family)
MKSMTGFGSSVAQSGAVRVAVTVQTWNHRHLDLVFRLPEDLRPLESTLRERVASRLGRGRCEIGVRLELEGIDGTPRRLDRPAFERFLEDAHELTETGIVSPEVRLGDLVRSPFLIPSPAETPDSADLAQLASRAVDRALAELDGARAAEGEKLSAALAATCAELRAVVAALGERRSLVGGELEENLRRRLDEILPEGARPLPPERLAQELALLAERSDVREELDRLAAHLETFETQRAGAGPHGRRLEFITQELLRELNTIGSKSRDVESTRLVVEGKVLNEQLREQVQNVE